MKFPAEFDRWILPDCATHNIEPSLFKALIWVESRFNPQAVGDGGAARGLCQMHEAACADVDFTWENQFIPSCAIGAGTAYFGRQLARFKLPLFALIAWNQGPSVAEDKNLNDRRFAAGLKYAAEVLKAQADAF